MTCQEALRHLDGGMLEPVYLITGEEPFLLETLLRHFLEKGLAPADTGFNYHRFRGDEISPDALVSMANTFPVSSPKRLIIVQSAAQLKDDQGLITAYIENPCPSTILVFAAPKPDMRKKLFASLKKRSQVIICAAPRERELPRWISAEAKKAGLHLSQEANWFLKAHLGANLLAIHQEIEKLALYLAESADPLEVREVSLADVQKIVGSGRAHSVFELTKAVGNKACGEAIRLLDQVLSEGGAALFVLAMLLRQWRQMALAREMLDAGLRESAIAKKVPMPPYFFKSFLEQVRRWPLREIEKAFQLSLSVDSQLKGGGLSAKSVLEGLILDLCTPQAKQKEHSESYTAPFREWQ